MTRFSSIVCSCVAILLAGCFATGADKAKDAAPAAEAAEKVYPTGYTDTPKLPHAPWRVHDDERPRPVVVTPGATNDAPPADAIVLFNGKNLDAWTGDKDKPAQWKVENGYLEVTNTGNIYTKQPFGSMQLHIEWMSPTPPRSNSQHRGNSGIFIADRYEIQVLDCFDNKTYADGQAGAIYGQYPPLVNAARKPGEWQTYEIVFIAPKFEGEKLVSPAYATVFHNGVLVQHHTELLGGTSHRKVGTYKAHGKAPIRLQDHNDKQQVRYRNIWVRELDRD